MKIDKTCISMVICPIFWPFINFMNTNIYEFYNKISLFIYISITLVTFLIFFIMFSLLLKKIRTPIECAVIFSICIISFFSYSIIEKISKFFNHHEDFLKLWIITSLTLFLITFVLPKKNGFKSLFFFFVYPF